MIYLQIMQRVTHVMRHLMTRLIRCPEPLMAGSSICCHYWSAAFKLVWHQFYCLICHAVSQSVVGYIDDINIPLSWLCHRLWQEVIFGLDKIINLLISQYHKSVDTKHNIVFEILVMQCNIMAFEVFTGLFG